MIKQITGQDLKSVLMDPKGGVLKAPYSIIPSPETEENVTIILSGKNGSEYNKTIGFIQKYPAALKYRCLYGQGVVIIQRNDEEGSAKEIRVSSIRPGMDIEVPSGYAHSISNIGKSFLVVVDNAPKEDKYKFEDPILSHKGLAYYVIDKKGEVAFEKNPNYLYHPQISNY